jgi:hypothetical protein
LPQVIDSSEIGYEVVSTTETFLSSDNAVELNLTAPAGKVVVGAGAMATVPNFRLITSQPLLTDGKATGWKIGGGGTPSGSWSLTVYAVCITA